MRRSYVRRVYTNAAPSRANWDEGQPRDCHHCGERLRITRDNVVMQRFPHVRSWHASCYIEWLEEHQ